MCCVAKLDWLVRNRQAIEAENTRRGRSRGQEPSGATNPSSGRHTTAERLRTRREGMSEPGKHPATERMRHDLARLEEMGSGQHEMAVYLREQLARFETVEEWHKARDGAALLTKQVYGC